MIFSTSGARKEENLKLDEIMGQFLQEKIGIRTYKINIDLETVVTRGCSKE